MAANRADARARTADIAAHQKQVDQHLHIVDAELVLRQAHAADGDDGSCIGVGSRRILQRRVRQAGGLLYLLPVRFAHLRLECLEAVGVLGNEACIQDAAVPVCLGLVVPCEQRLGDARYCRNVASGAPDNTAS